MTAPGPVATDPILEGHGFGVRLPDAWEGRIFRRVRPVTPFGLDPRSRSAATLAAPGGSGQGWLGEETRAVVHLATFGLPAQRGDYGSGAVELMRAPDVFVALLEFGPECRGTALFGTVGVPRIRAGQFDPNGLQRRLPGQAGCQVFFTENSRPLCLYVVIGSDRVAAAAATRVNAVLQTITVAAP